MPWFITSAKVLNTSKGWIEDLRCFGFFNTYIEAYNAVSNNHGDLHEEYYDYLVIEYMESGIHPRVFHMEWWKWNYAKNCWIKLSEDKYPKLVGTNIALG